MGSGKGNPNISNPADTGSTSGASGATEPSGPASTAAPTAGTNGGTTTPAGRPFLPERFVLHVPPGATSLSSAAGERKVDDLFRQVFRGKVPDKPIDLVNKLSQVVRTRKVEGREVPDFEFSPTSSTGTASLGGGQSVAQTSLFERAQAALNDAEKRLGALKPMKTPTDPENLDALLAVTFTTYKRLVNELGREGGPRDKRANRHFNVLIGPQGTPPAGKLGDDSLLNQIQLKFNLNKAGVNSAEDSANLANFRIVRDNLFDVHRSWTGFNEERAGDFSEQAASFSRALALIQDDVSDIESAFDEVGYDVTDRDSQPLKANENLTIQGLLSWIQEFASEEAPEMVDGGGAIGIAATFETFQDLEALAGDLAKFSESQVKDPNVTANVGALTTHLGAARLIADNMKKAVKAAQ